MKGSQPQPFAAVRLGPGEDIADIAWNPGMDFAGLIAICLSKGGVHLLELKGSSVSQVASLPASTAATCRMFSVFLRFSPFPLMCVFPFTSNRQHLSCDDCLEVRRENNQNYSVLYCV